jgi:hypothetical protein
LAQENLYQWFFEHKMTKNQRAKVDYIWQALLKEHRIK